MESSQNKAACCGQPSRTGKIFTCLPNWVFGQTTANEKAVLLTLQFHAPNIHPSLGTLARESGLSQRTVQRVLSELEAKGWVAKEETTTASGGKGSNRYQLLIWEGPEAAKSASLSEVALWTERPEGMATVARRVWPLWPGGMATVANKGDQSKESNLLTIEEPPLPPAAQGALRPPAVAAHPCRDRDGFLVADPEPQPAAAAEPPAMAEPLGQPQPQAATEPPLQPLAEVQPQPQQQNPPRPLPNPEDPKAMAPVKPKARKREAGFAPTVDDVPAALLGVQRELLAFWPARNPKGKRTERAWAVMLTEAQKIQDHQQGGTEILRQQLEEGAKAIVTGPGWRSLDFKRWMQYGTKAGTPIIGSGFAGKRTTMDRVMGAIALVEERERKAAAQPVGRSELVLAEVA